jgi:hypothetical protein
MTSYKLENVHGSFAASRDFVLCCEVYKNMFEDIGEADEDEVLIYTNDFDPIMVEKYYSFFEEMNALKVKTKYGEEIPYTQYISEYYSELNQNWIYRNEKPPHYDALIEIYRKYFGETKEIFNYFHRLHNFFVNKYIIRSMYFLTAIFVKFAANEREESKIIVPIMNILQRHNYLKYKKNES